MLPQLVRQNASTLFWNNGPSPDDDDAWVFMMLPPHQFYSYINKKLDVGISYETFVKTLNTSHVPSYNEYSRRWGLV